MDGTEILKTLIVQGGLGVVAGIFFYLYNQVRGELKDERAAHDATRKEKEALMEARRIDAKETLEKIEEPLQSIAQSQRFIADKLIGVQQG